MFQTLMEEDTTTRKQSWWKRRTQLEKCLMVVFALVLIVIIAVIITQCATKTQTPLAEKYIAPANELEKNITDRKVFLHECSNPKNDICLTSGCVKAAASVLESIDLNIDPCDDFYSFACGNFIKNAVIADDKTSKTTFTALTDQLQQRLRSVLGEPIKSMESTPIKSVKKYYQACINKKPIDSYGLHMFNGILKQIGGWPVLEGQKWNDGDFDWKELMYKFRKMGIDAGSLIEVSVGADLKNSSHRCVQIDQPELGLSREFLLKGENEKLFTAYFNYMVEVAVILGANRSLAESDLRESLRFEQKIAKLSMSKEQRRNISKLYNVMNINYLQEKCSGIPWLEYINNILEPDVQIGNKEVLILVSPEYVTSIMILLSQTPKRVQANYAIWRAIKPMISYLSDDIRRHQLNYMHALKGVTENPPRWKECVDEVTTSLPILASALYVRKYFPEGAKKNAVEMVNYITTTFKDIIHSLDWMDDTTRKSALDKASAIVDHTGYPDELLDDKKLEEYYNTLDVSDDEYLNSHLNIEKHTTSFSYKRLREPVNKTDWYDHGNAAQVNAFYHPLENSIMFPAGILQGAFFNEDRPRYMNYAAIGSVIGHELTHGFDDTGRQFDKDGNFVDWWEEKTKELFLTKARCIIEQYGNYTIPQTGEKINGINTQGENIADNGGIKEAYFAYQSWIAKNGEELELPGLNYTPNQLFWIAGAMNWCASYRPEILRVLVATDTHSPSEFRVLGPFSNLKYFSDDFGCPIGARMNPLHKCLVW